MYWRRQHIVRRRYPGGGLGARDEENGDIVPNFDIGKFNNLIIDIFPRLDEEIDEVDELGGRGSAGGQRGLPLSNDFLSDRFNRVKSFINSYK
jgi:hypothetical protein